MQSSLAMIYTGVLGRMVRIGNIARPLSEGWVINCALGALATVVYFLLPGVPQAWFYEAIGLSATIALMLGVRSYHPASPWAWYSIAAGLLSFTMGDVLWTIYEQLLHIPSPYPSVADVFYLLGYPLIAAGLIMMMRARFPQKDKAALIDAAIITIGIAVVSWVFLMSPYAYDPSLPLVEFVVSVGYPLADLLFLAMLVRLTIGAGARSPAYHLLIAGVLVMLVADALFMWLSLGGNYSSGDLLDAGWLMSYVLFGAAGLHPAMRDLTETSTLRDTSVSRVRLAVLAGASLTAPMVLLIQYLLGQRINVPIIFAGAVSLFLLVSFRMAGMAGDLQRHKGEARFRSLVQNSKDVILVARTDGAITYASPSAERTMGLRVSDLVGTKDFEWVHPESAISLRRLIADSLRSPDIEPRTVARYLHAGGSWRHLEVVASNLLDDPNVGGIVLTARDVSERKLLEEQLKHQAFHDSLTGLPNRVLLSDRIQHALDRSARYLISTAVLFLDLDGFKKVNDSLGHKIGDELLQEIARRLEASLRPGDTVARFGGDEFAVLLEDVAGTDEAQTVSERILGEIAKPVTLRNQDLFVSGSIGIAISTSGQSNPDELLKNADAAMYAAKSGGRGRYEVFDPEMSNRLLERLQLEGELHRALQENEFRVYYQPSIFLEDGTVVGFEALVRWDHPVRGILAPANFISIAEESGLIVPIGEWVLREACRQACEWKEEGPEDLPLSMSVNFSARQFKQPGLVQSVARALKESDLEPASLILEITESVAVEDVRSARETLERLKDLGVRLAVDDFGTGYSSLAYLQNFPVDILKIDRSFISDPSSNPKNSSIVATVIAFGRSLGIEVTAEGIENEEQLEWLRELGCPLGQGYHFNKPLPKEAAGLIALARGNVR